MDKFSSGDVARRTASFTNAAKALTNPTTVTLRIKDPTGTATTKFWPTPADLVNESTGVFYYDIDANQIGIWALQWDGTGAVDQTVNDQFFVEASSFDTNLNGWTDIRERVYHVIRDSARKTVTSEHVDTWIREAMEDLSSRLQLIEVEATGVTSGNSIAIPDGYVDIVWLKITSTGDADVAWVDEDIWNSYNESGSTPSRTLGRIFNNTFELYPTPATGTAYAFRYYATSTSNLTNFVPHMRTRLVNYARAHALWKMKEFAEGDRYLSLYESGLPLPVITNKNRKPGPIELRPTFGVFDEPAYRN